MKPSDLADALDHRLVTGDETAFPVVLRIEDNGFSPVRDKAIGGALRDFGVEREPVAKEKLRLALYCGCAYRNEGLDLDRRRQNAGVFTRLLFKFSLKLFNRRGLLRFRG